MAWQENRIQSAIDGTNPMLIMEMKGGNLVFGDTQFLPGYCVLLPKREVNSLNELTMEERSQFLLDMSIVGDAIMAVCYPHRINYDILGNTDAFLHAHIFPRYDWETPERKSKPVWLYHESNWFNEEKCYNPVKHEKIRNDIFTYLNSNY